MSGLAADIKTWARELGFASLGIADTDLGEAETHLMGWLAKDRHGEMGYMAGHGTRRSRPAELVPGTVRVLSVRLPYWPEARNAETVLNDPALGYIARYALGRDYHKLIRNKLQKLADRIESAAGPFGYRVFADSAPVLEKALAEKAGLGWIGKHTNLIDKDEGSWFFLGEMYTDLPLPVDARAGNHCGTCTRCLDACPTQAIVAPYELDARRCISYLTIELHGPIPAELRPLIGNRIFGCDDCQLVCPWNKCAQVATIGEATGGPSVARGPRLDPIGEATGGARKMTGRTSEASRASESARGPRTRVPGVPPITSPIGEATGGPSVARGPRLDPIGDFTPRHGLDTSTLIELFGWSEEEFLKRTEGSAIRRLGHERWLRNIAVALGNAPSAAGSRESLASRRDHRSALVREHVRWGLERTAMAALSNPQHR